MSAHLPAYPEIQLVLVAVRENVYLRPGVSVPARIINVGLSIGVLRRR